MNNPRRVLNGFSTRWSGLQESGGSLARILDPVIEQISRKEATLGGRHTVPTNDHLFVEGKESAWLHFDLIATTDPEKNNQPVLLVFARFYPDEPHDFSPF